MAKGRLATIKRLAKDGDGLCKRTGVSGSYTVTDQDVLWLIGELEKARNALTEALRPSDALNQISLPKGHRPTA